MLLSRRLLHIEALYAYFLYQLNSILMYLGQFVKGLQRNFERYRGAEMEFVDKGLQDRNREIGRILREARMEKEVSISRCAKIIRTTRRRYTAMEAGETIIGIAELERLVAFLEIPTYKIWHGQNPLATHYEVKVPATPNPGESLLIILDFQK